MAAEIPDKEPIEIVAGDTVKWHKSLADYSIADGWTLTYRLVGAGGIAEEFAAADDAGTWLVTIAASDLEDVKSIVTARLFGWVEKAGEKWTVFDEYIRIRPNVRVATDAELQTPAARTLAVIDAAIEGRLTADLEQYQINGRSVTKIPIRDLMQLRGIYRALVWKEQNGRLPGYAVHFGASGE